jgi:hypothetical protein
MGGKGIGVSKKSDVAGGYEIDNKFFEPFLDPSSAPEADDLLTKASGQS